MKKIKTKLKQYLDSNGWEIQIHESDRFDRIKWSLQSKWSPNISDIEVVFDSGANYDEPDHIEIFVGKGEDHKSVEKLLVQDHIDSNLNDIINKLDTLRKLKSNKP